MDERVTRSRMVGALLSREATRLGDLCEHVGGTPGCLQDTFGSHVVELGPDSASPGARVVYEARAQKRYTVESAVAKLRRARRNRDASIGVFVFDRASAPEGMDPVVRVGNDLLTVWEAGEASTFLYFKATFLVARALAHRGRGGRADLDLIVDRIASHAALLDGIETAARNAEDGATVHMSAEAMRHALKVEVEALRRHEAR